MEAQQKQAIIDMEELAELINFDNVTVSDQEREEAMKAEDVNVLTYGKEEINDILNEKMTPSQIEREKAEAVAPTPEVGEYGYEELGQNAEEVEFELEAEDEPEAEAQPAPEEEAPVAADAQAGEADEVTSMEDDWSFIDSLKVEGEVKKRPAPVVIAPEEEDRENKAVSREERRAYKQRLKEEAKAKKAAEKARLEQEKKERKERLKRLEEENKKSAAASFAPTAPRPKKNPNPYTPSAAEILAPKEQTFTPEATVKKAEIHTSDSGATRPRTFVPRSYTPLSITPENIHEVLGDDKGKKKKDK